MPLRTRNTSSAAGKMLTPEQRERLRQREQHDARVKAQARAHQEALLDLEQRKISGFVPPDILGDPAAPHPANRSIFRCGRPDCSAFANVSLILATSTMERVSLLSGYADWFASLLFLVTVGGNQRCLACRAAVRKSFVARTACHCIPIWTSLSDNRQEEFGDKRWVNESKGTWNISYSATRHVHYVSAFAHAMRIAGPGGGAQGFLVAHFDFFINVRIFHGAALHQPWFPNKGQWTFRNGLDPVPRCFPVVGPNRTYFEADRSWFWVDDGFDWAKRQCKKSVEELGELECCYGWADIFYVPSALLTSFSYLLGAFPDTHHEVAVPTALRILSRRSGVGLRALSCVGGTIAKIKAVNMFRPAHLTPQFCGHKLNLSDADTQEAVRDMLHKRWGD